jgi:hypothetical protein
MKEIRVLAERWRIQYDTVRPHYSLGYRPPARAAWLTQTDPAPETKTGYGKVESKNRFPLFHAPDCGEVNNSNAAVHSPSHWCKTSGRPQLHRLPGSAAWDFEETLRQA